MGVFRSEPYFLELVPKGIDKARSLSVLLEKLGMTKDEMIAVGDGFNDLSMIQYAGLPTSSLFPMKKTALPMS